MNFGQLTRRQRGRAGDGQVREFAEIHFGTGQGRRWATEMNFGQPAGRQRGGAGDGQAREFAEIHFGTGLDRRWAGARVCRNSFRHGSGQAMGDRNEFRSTDQAAAGRGRHTRRPK
jgi:hypothetical protein